MVRRPLRGWRLRLAAASLAALYWHGPAARAADVAVPAADGATIAPNDLLTARASATNDAERAARQAALDEAQRRVQHQPQSAAAHQRLAVLFSGQSQWPEAIDHLRQALRLQPGMISAANQLAWLLAVCPSADFRNGGGALELARRWRLGPYAEHPTLLDTLAAALAEQGKFDEAVRVAAQAVERARQTGRLPEAAQIEARRQLYLREQTYQP